MTKVCNACEKEKDLGAYSISPNTKDGRNHKCKVCIKDGVGANITIYKRICNHDDCNEEFETQYIVKMYCCDKHKVSQGNKNAALKKKALRPRGKAKKVTAINEKFLVRGNNLNIRTANSCMNGSI